MYDAAAPLSEAELRELDAQYCSWGDTVHYVDQPKFFESCDGSYMFDAQGRPYLDLQMWYSTANFGYRNPRLVAAMHRQLDRLPQVASSHLHREKVELAALIARDAEARFGAKGRVHFNVGGAQAVDDSLKLVRNAAGGRTRMFAFQGGYHGRTLGASTVTSSYRYRRRFGHFSDTAHFVEFPYAFRGPKGMSKEEYGEKIVADFARLFESDFHAVYDVKAEQSEFAAFYVEPVQGTGGYVIPPKNFFKDLKKVLDQYGVMLVVDEVQMGMYRTGKLWAIEHFGVTPDVMIFGKSVTNGLNPLSGIWAKEEFINPTVFPPGSTHSTFNANPLGTSIALETLRMAMDAGYERSVPEKGAYFLEGLQDLQKRWPQIGDVDGLGLALRCELCEADGFTPDRALMDRMVAEGLRGELDVDGQKMGLILNVGGYYKNVITLAPSLDITHEEIDLALKLLDALLRRCVQA
ncbi:aspartate aminotransferase family protein [Phenylobacterium sp.]|jgi:4-aminobutyrate aminotransferase-like enzyme|uniref:aspartate aminotransferase family protein n=1 Tax=Phenylobacterium sp. TaxID=1871053 RepID=UPI002F3E2A8A